MCKKATVARTAKVIGILLIALLGYCIVPRTPHVIAPRQQTPTQSVADIKPKHYIEITESCGPYWNGDSCVVARSGPGTEFPVVGTLRTGVVLEVEKSVAIENRTWYKISFSEWLRYPERVSGDWYIAEDFVRYFEETTTPDLPPKTKPATTKRIVVNRGDQILYAFDGDTLVMKQEISTGIGETPTPLGTFLIYRKTPSRYMQGPLPDISEDYYDLPGVPWNLYFTKQGAVIHGAYWHNQFGQPRSHGCINLPPESARLLYEWADVGVPITILD